MDTPGNSPTMVTPSGSKAQKGTVINMDVEDDVPSKVASEKAQAEAYVMK